jgi:Domain of unknown function (DUF4926)
MKVHKLETLVLERDIPERGLRKGDLGAIVELYEPDGLDVEFVRLPVSRCAVGQPFVLRSRTRIVADRARALTIGAR